MPYRLEPSLAALRRVTDRDRPAPPADRRLAGLPRVTGALIVGALVLASLPWVSALWESGEWPAAGRERWASTLASLIAVAFGTWVLALLRRERRLVLEHLAALERLSLTEPLTGLGNRRALERDLVRTMLRARRLDLPLTLLFLDVDDLKIVNDRFGHVAGDETLRGLGHVLRTCSREGTDAAYRVGGDEFVLVLTADVPGAEAVAQRVRATFLEDSPNASTLSVGLVEWDGAASASELLNAADRGMYRSKHMARRAESPAAPGWDD